MSVHSPVHVPPWVLGTLAPKPRQSALKLFDVFDIQLLRPHLSTGLGLLGRQETGHNASANPGVWGTGLQIAGHLTTGAPRSDNQNLELTHHSYAGGGAGDYFSPWELPNAFTLVFRYPPYYTGYNGSRLFNLRASTAAAVYLSRSGEDRTMSGSASGTLTAAGDGNWHVFSWFYNNGDQPDSDRRVAMYDGEIIFSFSSQWSNWTQGGTWTFGSYYDAGSYTIGAEFLALITHAWGYAPDEDIIAQFGSLHHDPWQVLEAPRYVYPSGGAGPTFKDFDSDTTITTTITVDLERIRDVDASMVGTITVSADMVRDRDVASTTLNTVTVTADIVRDRDFSSDTSVTTTITADFEKGGLVDFVSSTSMNTTISVAMLERDRGLVAAASFVTTITTNAVGPTAVNDGVFFVPFEGVYGGDLSVNDIVGDAPFARFARTGFGPFWGLAILDPDGVFTYLADPGIVDTDAFQYKIWDTDGNVSNVATVNLEIRGLVDFVSATSTSFTLTADMARTRDVDCSLSVLTTITADFIAISANVVSNPNRVVAVISDRDLQVSKDLVLGVRSDRVLPVTGDKGA